MRRVTLFITAFGAWLVLVYPCRYPDIVAGVAVAALVAGVMREGTVRGLAHAASPRRCFWAAAYVAVLLYYIVKANVDVAYRVLHPAMPIRPGIVKVRTSLKTEGGITLLANSVTLTPGTLTVDVGRDGILYVHWIDVRSVDIEGATAAIIGRFEWFLRRIVE